MSRQVRVSQAGSGRAHGGERRMGTATYGGRRSKERRRVSGERPMGATSFRQQFIQASCQSPPPSPPACLDSYAPWQGIGMQKNKNPTECDDRCTGICSHAASRSLSSRMVSATEIQHACITMKRPLVAFT